MKKATGKQRKVASQRVARLYHFEPQTVRQIEFHSQVFGEERNYRVFLPPDYDTSGKRYPVVYFFHGHSERHNRPPRGNPGYDSGSNYGGDTIAAFVMRLGILPQLGFQTLRHLDRLDIRRVCRWYRRGGDKLGEGRLGSDPTLAQPPGFQPH